ncbi:MULTISPECIES: 2-oxo-4-hydroxy-4-carboxy-5-ureidoimidazoline decarboxylase [Allobranchiibius]|uniref:2-oxo-4-hydroxy-4-carboxy-5-ureidoimidazoline decarboxylase n=1 Tax=Allobranchiibius huperziae TaxID=1874116 RepID=A0A853DHK3_9MICO|nr:2-oxo-4-hydroxy-4-carboxy-5-ureidoimidazoline decarboxylase [Allobranchiibius sp. GilTou73]NYJ76248.1 2-oxo-4-hydroxy-4-carboxy-5-ureidoimidazoline decarboxylase [Allobranchiibius huperziae]UIJ35658.1 2-oxo-4-hydroxy-4-carboxy-5-ureidoimidazoline decarboxylase [Allobranchiibius sp. GilTou73]
MTDIHSLPAGVFDDLAADRASDLLRTCCAAPSWVRRMVQGRPYGDRDRLLSASDTAFAALTEQDVADALADHPRIGERPAGSSASGHFSRAEQASVTDADDQVRHDLLQGNRAYERRFDRVFLIRAAGRTPAEILAELHRRMDNDEQTELAEVIEQLRMITRLRLEAMVR